MATTALIVRLVVIVDHCRHQVLFYDITINLKGIYSTDFQKFNFKIAARALPVIPPKFTGVPITQPEKIILM
jgi:hypothetical protein